MALPVLDGNQTATTLSSVVTGGEHIVAHSVVCLGSTAIANITNAVSGSVVSISNFPSTQTVAGAVTASNLPLVDENFSSTTLGAVRSALYIKDTLGGSGFVAIGNDQDEGLPVRVNGAALPISGTVTVGNSVTIGSLPAISGTVTVGSSVTIGSLPAISGTVTANVLGRNANYTSGVTALQLPIIGFDETIETADAGLVVPVQITNTLGVVGGSNALPISGTLTANLGQGLIDETGDVGSQAPRLVVGVYDVDGIQLGANRPFPISGTVTVGNSVTIGSLPAISGTVTANFVTNPSYEDAAGIRALLTQVGGFDSINGRTNPIRVDEDGEALWVKVTNEISGTVTANSILVLEQPVYEHTGTGADRCILIGTANADGGQVLHTSPDNPMPISGSISGTVTVGNSVTIGSLPAISGAVTVSAISTSVTARLVDISGTAVSYASTGTAGTPSTDVVSVQGVSGGTSVPVSISSVTIGAVPNGALTTRFGSVTTANTAQISSAVTNASRKYLLIQNVTTSSNVITIGVGFTPTTTQGIQLTAGAGITFESSYIPTGAVYVLSSVTASPFTILEA